MNISRSKSLCCVALLGVACSGNDKSAGTSNHEENAGRRGSDGAGDRGGGGGGTSSAGGANAEVGVTGAKLKWQVVPPTDPNGGGSIAGIEGVKVCVDAHPGITCATTDADGDFTLVGLPTDTELVLVLEKDGYVPILKPIETSNIDMESGNPIFMVKETDAVMNLGFDIDRKSLGGIDFFVIGQVENNTSGFGPLPGATASLSPKAGNGPIYVGVDGAFDPSLKVAPAFAGAFFNVPPGNYKVSFTPPAGYTCASISFPFAGWGFPVANEAAVRVPVREGHITAGVGVFCTQGG